MSDPHIKNSPLYQAAGADSVDIAADLQAVADGLHELEAAAVAGGPVERAVAALARLILGRDGS